MALSSYDLMLNTYIISNFSMKQFVLLPNRIYMEKLSIFGYLMSHMILCLNFLAIVFDIDWHYTMAWFPTLLLKTFMSLSSCPTMMCIRFRRLYATMVKMRHCLATLNSNNFIVYGQRQKVLRTSRTF